MGSFGAFPVRRNIWRRREPITNRHAGTDGLILVDGQTTRSQEKQKRCSIVDLFQEGVKLASRVRLSGSLEVSPKMEGRLTRSCKRFLDWESNHQLNDVLRQRCEAVAMNLMCASFEMDQPMFEDLRKFEYGLSVGLDRTGYSIRTGLIGDAELLGHLRL